MNDASRDEDSEINLDDERLDLAAAALALSFVGPADTPLPDALRRRVDADAARFFQPNAPRSFARRAFAVSGWLAAAASWLVTAWVFWTPRPVETVVQVREARVEVPVPTPLPPPLASPLPGARTAALKATDHPLARGAGGELVWSQPAQEGLLKLNGLAEVDPKRGVYQLWIFDEARDKRYPVDGGTFTIDPADGTVVVRVKARLPVDRPTLFAVTLEPPGGVVVSDRQRLLLTAAYP